MCYKYSYEFASNVVFSILDDFKRHDCGLCIEHNDVIISKSNDEFNELAVNILLLYNDFVDSMFKEL